MESEQRETLRVLVHKGEAFGDVVFGERPRLDRCVFLLLPLIVRIGRLFLLVRILSPDDDAVVSRTESCVAVHSGACGA